MSKVILLVEDDPDDEALTLRALRHCNILNELVVARDGAEALDYLFGTGIHAARDASAIPAIILLDLKLPKIDGIEVLRRLRANDAPGSSPQWYSRHQPRNPTCSRATAWAATATSASPWTLSSSSRPYGPWGSTGWS